MTSPHPERFSSIAERVHQEAPQRYLPLRLKAPGAGMARIVYSTGDDANASIAFYLYGASQAAHRG
ncbi:hypothetical protein [Ensifer sp. B1-9]|uniref:hypothetical protein n=1 Tax=Ensifer sp. B1-9 TaxID=3141455 RepID=UPI003D22396A